VKIIRTNKTSDSDRSWSLETEVDRTLARLLALIVGAAVAVVLWRIGFPAWEVFLRLGRL
jgi:hypothetical protein